MNYLVVGIFLIVIIVAFALYRFAVNRVTKTKRRQLTSADQIEICQNAVSFLAMKGWNVSCDQAPCTIGQINSLLAGLRAKASSAELPPEDQTTLANVWGYLSTKCSEVDGDITIDTVREATSKSISKRVSYEYFAGAFITLILVIMAQSYYNQLQDDVNQMNEMSANYSQLLSRNIDTSAKANKIDSVRLIAKILYSRVNWIEGEVNEYPFGYKIQTPAASVDTLKSGETRLLAKVNSSLFLGLQVCDNVRLFILPMLYGIAGAFLWIIRRISEQIKTFNLTWTKLIRNRARLVFGLFVGIFFGWLFKAPTSASAYTITPFLLAFIGGYNVEILFTIMDKVVDALSYKAPNIK